MAGYARSIQVPVRVDDVTGRNVVSAEVFVAYDGDLLTATGVDATGTLLTAGWSIEMNVVEGTGAALDTLKIAMATDDDVLVGEGVLIYVDFDVADVRHPASSPLELAHVLLNDGDPVAVAIDGSVTLVGVDGMIASAPEEIIPRWSIDVTVTDADEDRDGLNPDSFEVAVTNGSQTETMIVEETGANTGIFAGDIATAFSLSFSSDDGIVQAKAGDVIEFCYGDSLDGDGITVERCATTAMLTDDDEVVEPFGDADGNGSVQAFDAARVLYHRLAPFLSGLDSLSANVDSLAPFGEIDPYDASLILQKGVGIFDRFQVQEPGPANHPQPETRTRPKSIPETRELTLQVHEGYVSVWAEERDGILAGELQIDGLAGTVSMAGELGDFLVASRERGEGLQVVFAGAAAVSGPGELLRVYPGVGPGSVRFTRASFNGGRIGARVTESEGKARPLSYALYANAPNPFNPQTASGYVLPLESAVELTVYDVVGQQVRTLVSGMRAAGTHQAVWDGCDEAGQPVGSGVYFYRLTARGEGNEWRSDASPPADLRFRQMRCMLLLK